MTGHPELVEGCRNIRANSYPVMYGFELCRFYLKRGFMKKGFYILLLVSFFLLMGSLSMAQISKGGKETGMKDIREPAVAGTWYPGKPDVLSADVKRYLGNAKQDKLGGEVVALVSPHAGYPYSGQVAAYAYQLI